MYIEFKGEKYYLFKYSEGTQKRGILLSQAVKTSNIGSSILINGDPTIDFYLFRMEGNLHGDKKYWSSLYFLTKEKDVRFIIIGRTLCTRPYCDYGLTKNIDIYSNNAPHRLISVAFTKPLKEKFISKISEIKELLREELINNYYVSRHSW